MSSRDQELHVAFLPFLAPGHMIPVVDIARLFAAHGGVRATIITTPINAQRFKTTIDRHVKAGRDIKLELLPFPSAQAGLPDGCENISSCNSPQMSLKFLHALKLFQPKVETLLREIRPDCILSDILFPWTVDIAAELGIPRVGFYACSFFSVSVIWALNHYKPHMKADLGEREPFIVPNLPDQVLLTRSQLPEYVKIKLPNCEIFDEMTEAEKKSFGVVVNSFHDLEPGYADYYRKIRGIKAWQVGPVSLSNTDKADKIERGDKNFLNTYACLNWLNSRKPESVLYICFGTLNVFSEAQLTEMAAAFEDASCDFIWVVTKVLTEKGDEDEWWLPEGFEERMEESGKGMIIKGWAPQVLILEHPAIGGFLTHCGANSILEGVTAGVPMVTWPIITDQFYNEKVVTQVMKFGVGVGNEDHVMLVGDTPLISRDKIEQAVSRVMGEGDEAREMRNVAKKLGESAKRAVEEGGSSYNDLKTLIEDIKSYGKN